MVSANRQTKRITADDHVPEGHSTKADEIGESSREAAVKLEDAEASLDAPS